MSILWPAEEEAVSHTVTARRTGERNVELDGPKAFAKSVGRIFPVTQDTQNSFKYK